MLHMREQLIAAVKAHAQGEIAKHRANVNVYLEHPAGIGEHSDITEAIQVELDKIARYHDQVEVIDKYFKQMAKKPDPHEVMTAALILRGKHVNIQRLNQDPIKNATELVQD